jgi:signal transduction histidine kinase/CheY-like chemotaxis protein
VEDLFKPKHIFSDIIKFDFTIRTKFILIFTILVALICVFIYTYFPLKLEKQAIQSIADKARSINDMTAFNVSSTLLFEDKNDMQEILKGVKQNQDLAYLVVLNHNGEVFSAIDLETALKADYKLLSNHKPITEDRLIYRTRAHIIHKNKIIGDIFLGLFLKNLRVQIEKSRRTITYVSLVIFILGVVAVFLTSTVITGPLKKMAHTIEEISDGDLSQRVTFSSKDEVGKLAHSFNLMVENLQTYSRKLEELNNTLESKVVERTEKLQQEMNERIQAQEERQKLEEQLRQSQKMESLGTLAGGIAHDFNNILSAIMGYTELTLGIVPGDSEARSNLKRILAASNRAKELIKQILTFSRKSEKERKPILLNKVVEDVLKLMRSILPTTIEIRRHILPMENPVLANKAEIHQVVMNLCTNAGYAMGTKGGVLQINLKEIKVEHGAMDRINLEPGTYQQLTVSDTGHGMTPEIMERIFEPYFTTKKGKGTGMGLSVVHGIVKSYGGNITVYSEPGIGTTFHIFLPICQEKETGVDTDHTSALLPGNEWLLLVDDDPILVELGGEILKKMGYHVVARTNSIEALEVFNTEPNRFDLVISDQTMPNLTGVQLAKEIKKIRTDIPIILFSGFSEVINEDNYKSLGINAFLMKPVLEKDLATTIRKVLDKR